MTYGWYKAFIICPRCFVSLVVEQFFSRKEKEKTTHWEQVASVNYILRFPNNLWLLLGYSQVLTSKWVYKRMDPSRMLLVGAHALARTNRRPVNCSADFDPSQVIALPANRLTPSGDLQIRKRQEGEKKSREICRGKCNHQRVWN